MRLNSIKPGEGSKKTRLRVGRGASAGQGKTCGRGVKGQRARKGGYLAPLIDPALVTPEEVDAGKAGCAHRDRIAVDGDGLAVGIGRRRLGYERCHLVPDGG